MIQIYDYLDYRKYLKNLLKEKKAENVKFSHRYILGRMNIASSSYLLNIIAGKYGLNIKRVSQLGGILGLSSGEINYFKKLVYFDKAKSADEKNDYYQQIMDYRKRKVAFISGKHFSLFSKWYFVVVREMLHIISFKDDYGLLAKLVTPQITVDEATEAITSLEYLGLIARNIDGFFKPIDNAISTGDDITQLEVTKYHEKVITLSLSALGVVPLREREISAMTLSISEDKFQLIKLEIQEFRRKILQIASNDSNPQRVYHCNFQFFPGSEKIGGDK